MDLYHYTLQKHSVIKVINMNIILKTHQSLNLIKTKYNQLK